MTGPNRRDWKVYLELIGAGAVVLGLLFVGLELRQSTIAARAAAYQELGIATANIWYLNSGNRELNDIFWRVVVDAPEDGYSNLSESDKRLFLSHQIATLRLYETVYLQVQQGLLEESALASLGWKGFEEQALRRIWADIEMFVDPAFAKHLSEIGAI